MRFQGTVWCPSKYAKTVESHLFLCSGSHGDVIQLVLTTSSLQRGGSTPRNDLLCASREATARPSKAFDLSSHRWTLVNRGWSSWVPHKPRWPLRTWCSNSLNSTKPKINSGHPHGLKCSSGRYSQWLRELLRVQGLTLSDLRLVYMRCYLHNGIPLIFSSW